MKRKRKQVWHCAECGRTHPCTESLHVSVNRPEWAGQQPLQLCSFECVDVLRVRIGLLAERTVTLHARKDGTYVEVYSNSAKVRLQDVARVRAQRPASLQDLLLGFS